MSHLGCLTWIISPGLYHLGCLTWIFSPGLSYLDCLTWVVSPGFSHLGCLTWLLTWVVLEKELFNEFFVLFSRPNNNAIVFVDVLYLQPINELPNIFDVHEQERDDEMVTCRQHAADNIPVIISTVNHLYNKMSLCLSVHLSVCVSVCAKVAECTENMELHQMC